MIREHKVCLGSERSQFLSKAKYEEIVTCLKAWESTDAKARKEKWSQGHAWTKKYALLLTLFCAGDSAVLIFDDAAELNRKAKAKSKGKSKDTKNKEVKYRLACSSGTINTLYSRSYINPLATTRPQSSMIWVHVEC